MFSLSKVVKAVVNSASKNEGCASSVIALRRCRGRHCVKSHIVYRLCNHMVYTLSLIQPGVIVQEIALFECVNSLVQVDAADSELSEHQCDLPRERRLANGDAFPTKPFA